MKNITIALLVITLSACASMNESLQLGAGMGAATGVVATYTAHKTTGQSPSFENIALGAGIGLRVGLLTSYLTHKNVEKTWEDIRLDQTEMHFGDLPPSPFMIPKSKRRGKR